MPKPRLIVCRVMCSCRAMIGVSGCSAADSARNGISAHITIAATAG